MTDESNALFLVIGALHIDEIATATVPIIVGESNPVNWSKSVGGVAGNVARSASQSVKIPTGLSVVLIANIGAGKDATELSSALAHSNVEVLPIEYSGASTGRYSAILQDTGELLVGLADVEQAQAITLNEVQKLTDFASANAVILDTNLSSTSLIDISRKVRNINESCLIAALGVSPSKITRLQDALAYLDILFCNESEARGLAANLSEEKSSEGMHDMGKLLTLLCDSGCEHVVMTCGKDKVQVHSKDQHTELAVPHVNNPYSVNGPGDALAGASLGALMHKLLTHDTLVHAVNQYGIPAALKVVTGEHRAPNLSNH